MTLPVIYGGFSCLLKKATKGNPTYAPDSITEASFVTVKIYHGGIMKRIPEKHYVGGNIDYIDYVNAAELNITEFKKMAEICGYLRDSITFWRKCERPGSRWKLISTDFEASAVGKSIQKDSVLEIYFEHLDSYFQMDKVDLVIQSNIEENNKHQMDKVDSEILSCGDFSDSEVDLSDDVLVDTHEKRNHNILEERELLSDEIKRKMVDIEGDPDCVDSEDVQSLDSDSETESFNFPKFNPKTDEDNPVLCLEYTFGTKQEFKHAVATHEIKNGKYIQWSRNDSIRMEARCIHHPECKWIIMASRMQRDKAFQIKTYNPIHTCKEWHHENRTITRKFNDCMADILKLDPAAAAWLTDKDPSEWSMSHFSSDAKCDTLLNNLCEVFNSMILDARDKPIVTLLEKLRYLLMARMLANREKAEKWNLGDVCPKIKDILHKNQIAAAEYIPRKSNYWSYEILGATITDNWAVDLQNKSCSCRKWSLTGVPCKHAIAAIWAKKDNILDYVHDCYKVETYRRIYENSILPMNGPQLWPKSSKVPPLPPKIVRNSKRGRKQKLRRKEQDEVGASRTKMKRKQKSLDCSICHKPGHNKRTCKYNIVQEETTSSVRPKLHVRRGYDEVGHGDVEQEQMGQVEVEVGPEFIWESFQSTQKSDQPFEV